MANKNIPLRPVRRVAPKWADATEEMELSELGKAFPVDKSVGKKRANDLPLKASIFETDQLHRTRKA
jgi:hypothetical protein